MLYNDKETREAEERFQAMLAKVHTFAEKDAELLNENLKLVEEKTQLIIDKPDKTEEEIKFLKEISGKLLHMIQGIQDMQLILQESMLRKSTAFYEHVKQLALAGDEKAKKIYEGLRPAYEDMIRSQISDN